MLNPADPAFFALTPVLDVVLAANTTDYHFAVKHTADTPLGLGLAGPIAPPGFKFALQAFIVNLAVGPPFPVVSTNVALGNVYKLGRGRRSPPEGAGFALSARERVRTARARRARLECPRQDSNL